MRRERDSLAAQLAVRPMCVRALVARKTKKLFSLG